MSMPARIRLAFLSATRTAWHFLLWAVCAAWDFARRYRECPRCGYGIPKLALKCRYCGTWFV